MHIRSYKPSSLELHGANKPLLKTGGLAVTDGESFVQLVLEPV